MKQTAVEWLFKQIYGETNYINSYTTDGKDAIEAFEKAKEMEKEQSHQYAEFAIRCDRKDMKILNFEDFIKL